VCYSGAIGDCYSDTMTSCRDAIKLFEGNKARNKEGLKAEDAIQVKLYFMIPPISKMDGAALSTLKACEHLAMSTNNIDKIANLSGMENLKVLSLGRNNIKKLENMDGVGGRLEQLWVSYNPIDKLTGIEKCKELTVFFMGNCKVSAEKEFDKLCEVPKLEELVFYGNPLHKKLVDEGGEMGYVRFVHEKLPNLRKLDGISMVEWKQKMNSGNLEQLKEVFAKMDADNNGTLSVKEVKDALKDEEIQNFLRVTPAKVDEEFAKIEGDELTFDQFVEHFSAE